MPIYEYRCSACGHHLEALQKMSESPLRKCPECGKSQLKRLVSASQFRLKGSGWYETDFKNKGETKRNLVEHGSAEASESAADKSTDTAAKDEAGKAIAAAKNDGDAAKPAKPKPVAKPAAARSKPAAKSRAKASRG
jgi:putative FmdB family regulatory protein